MENIFTYCTFFDILYFWTWKNSNRKKVQKCSILSALPWDQGRSFEKKKYPVNKIQIKKKV